MLLISFIIPFYYGNQYMEGLMNCLNQIQMLVHNNLNDNIEAIVVNDSPEEEVQINCHFLFKLKVLNHKKNVGIQASRIDGLNAAEGKWINFLDQDDLLIPENYSSYFKFLRNYDVIVSNGYYQQGDSNKKIYKNIRIQRYYVRKSKFINIRNLIPSPGEVLIRKKCVPTEWEENILKKNGADDWMLWLLLFYKNAKFAVNGQCVYIHRSTEAGNLSFDLDKMYASCDEMQNSLRKYLPQTDIKKLKRAIDFKYLKDTKKLDAYGYLKYLDCTVNNIIYKGISLL